MVGTRGGSQFCIVYRGDVGVVFWAWRLIDENAKERDAAEQSVRELNQNLECRTNPRALASASTRSISGVERRVLIGTIMMPNQLHAYTNWIY